MPEGPEVRKIVRFLNRKLSGRELLSINAVSGRYSRKEIEGLSKLKFPIKILSVNCKGKFIWFELENGVSIWNTLGLSGWWVDEKEKHSRVEFITDVDSYWYIDQRNFGTFKIVFTKEELTKKLNSLGLDLLNHKVSFGEFLSRMRKYNGRSLLYVLMKQSIIAGIGVYLRSEILYECGFKPVNLISNYDDNKLNILYETIIRKMKECNRVNGCEFQVYQKDKDKKGNDIIKEIGPHKRAYYWVKEIQKI
jgi:formamidopyrimidine-DNA glycosylase